MRKMRDRTPRDRGLGHAHERQRLVGHVDAVDHARQALRAPSGPDERHAAHCSVTEQKRTSSSGHTVWARTRGAAAPWRRWRSWWSSGNGARRAARSCRRRTPCRPRAASGRSGLADRRASEKRVDVDAVEEVGRVAALDVDLAERRDVDDADRRRARRAPRARSPRRASSPAAGRSAAAATARRRRTRRRAATCQSCIGGSARVG